MIFFDHPELLNLAWLLPFMILLIRAGWLRMARRFQAIGGGRFEQLISHQPSQLRYSLKGIMLILAVALIFVALARPRWGFEWKEIPRGGSDLMVVLDLSSSMLATDIPPSRLERAKREIIDLLRLLEGDRLGIVAFAGIPFVQCPLTTDYRMAEMFVRNLSTSLIPVQGTDLGAAISTGISALEKGGDGDSQSRAIVLIT